jgi:ABC-type sugar transport system substrate-binding protein
MRKARVLSILFVVVLLAVAVIAEAQQPKKVQRIGFLSPLESPQYFAAFRQGLHELGYTEGQNVIIEYRSANLVSELTFLL